MRPSSASPCSSAWSWLIFSFFTRRPSWPSVTSLAFARPWSTNFWSTSFSTTSTSAAASTWAISPPIVPAPTTAALNTNMVGEPFRSLFAGGRRNWPRGVRGRLQRGLLGRLGGEAPQRARERVALRAADEDRVGERGQRAALRQLVVERECDRGAALLRGCELDRLRAGQAVLEHGGHEAGARLGRGHLLGHEAAPARHRPPDELGAHRGPFGIEALDVAEAVHERRPAPHVGPELERRVRRHVHYARPLDPSHRPRGRSPGSTAAPSRGTDARRSPGGRTPRPPRR